MKILSILLMLVGFTQAPKSPLLSNGVYKSASDFDAKNLTNGFSKGDKNHKIRDEVTRHVFVRYGDSSHKYNYADIWGFRKNGIDWRIFNNKLFRVVYAGKAYVYIRPTRTVPSLPGQTKFQTTWFSVTAGSPVYGLERDTLLMEYSNNAALVKKVSAMRDNALVNKKNKATGEYEFISWLD